jgi:hypothetical protein
VNEEQRDQAIHDTVFKLCDEIGYSGDAQACWLFLSRLRRGSLGDWRGVAVYLLAWPVPGVDPDALLFGGTVERQQVIVAVNQVLEVSLLRKTEQSATQDQIGGAL